MTNHIPPERLLPQDMVDVYDYGPPNEPFASPALHRMHAVDAKHAMAVEPDRWKLEPPQPEQFEYPADLDLEPPDEPEFDEEGTAKPKKKRHR